MSIGPLKQRSSWPLSFLTGLIGWNGLFMILAVAFGNTGSAEKLFLRPPQRRWRRGWFCISFFAPRMDRGLIPSKGELRNNCG